MSITSSWGNGHATTYRGLVRALERQGHDVLFLERDVPWYRKQRDLPEPPYAEVRLYGSLQELQHKHAATIRNADTVVIGSYVPEGKAVADWVLNEACGAVLFYDIDTPVTLHALTQGTCEYLDPAQIPRFDAYLSFTGGPTLEHLERHFGARQAHPLYCSVDPDAYPVAVNAEEPYSIGYLGTYSQDRQDGLERLLVDPARRMPQKRFIVAGPNYPTPTHWPDNVERRDHVPPHEHPGFYHAQRFTLNLTRSAMRTTGHAPSVRLFEAASTATPVISDPWPGLSTLFKPGKEILIARRTWDVLRYLSLDDDERTRIGRRARKRVLQAHTPRHRARTLTRIVHPILQERIERV